jgi:flagellar motor switch protein FliN/FliY
MSETTGKTQQQDPQANDLESAMDEQTNAGRGATKVAKFTELEDESNEGTVNMNAILDVPVTLSMEIGRTKINIRNLLQLNQGSVVELDRLAGESMDVLVNGTLIAQGEVVMVNEKFGLRLTDIISPTERIKRLK